jgi:tRNA-5-taurinomethyluridine 2-sulfurtransferase
MMTIERIVLLLVVLVLPVATGFVRTTTKYANKRLIHWDQPFGSETPISIPTPKLKPLETTLETTLDSIRSSLQEQSPSEIYKLLVQKGFAFHSYQTRFDGTWSRRSEWSVNVKPYLMAHGISPLEAEQEARRPYHQVFQRKTVTEQGIVFTIDTDHGRRVQTYHLGNWTEPIDDTNVTNNINVLYAGKEASTLQRNTVWHHNLHHNQHEHITTTLQPEESTETTRRYLDYSQGTKRLVVERNYQAPNGTTTSCQEVFLPIFSDPTCTTRQSTIDRVPGCIATVNVMTTLFTSNTSEQPTILMDGDADAMVSRGLLALLSQVLHGQIAENVLTIIPETITERLGLSAALSQGRNDGLASMVRIIQGQIRTLLQNDSRNTTSTISPTISITTTTPGSATPKPTVAMLLSGGVDSSVALHVLKSQGYDVTAFYLKIWLEDELAHLGHCPWEEDYNLCMEICQQANVPLESISLQTEYKEKVISYTVAEAQRGRTPNPDIMCNARVKFGCFYDAIEERGFDYVASGHYAQLTTTVQGVKQLLRAPDPIKDQSYFLCALNQEQLQRVLFPIGHLEKQEVRQLAQEYDLPNKNRPDSQGLCFLGKVKFDEFLSAYLGTCPGNIIDARTGSTIGRHNGVWYHTVGQRKGIGKVLDPKATARGPWYVVAKDPEKNIVYASNEYDEESFTQARSDVYIEDIHWISGSPPTFLLNGPARFGLKIRHGPTIVNGYLELLDDGVANVKLDQKDGGLAPGQYVVFYEPDGIECYGGGVISERHWARFLLDRITDVVVS